MKRSDILESIEAAAARVEVFLDSRTKGPRSLTDPEVIYSHNDHELRVSDLRALIAVSRSMLR